MEMHTLVDYTLLVFSSCLLLED
uniref:Uncharacterized protein n=1 Tax=Rhizophora mucronata TaxID=61149 RepID=A0A2P2QZN9_RHIMU